MVKTFKDINGINILSFRIRVSFMCVYVFQLSILARFYPSDTFARVHVNYGAKYYLCAILNAGAH